METNQRLASNVSGKLRARDLGLPFSGETGPYNAITDVVGVNVGYSTVISDAPASGRGPARTGITAILPRGRTGPLRAPVWAGFHSLNGNGEMTGTHWIKEAGYFTGPIAITNTHSLGTVHQSILEWMIDKPDTGIAPYKFILPVVGETSDAYLNDMDAFHVTGSHVKEALNNAASGPLAEGNVGGGTGMICFEFKGGTGTSSRVVDLLGSRYTVGCLVQANFGMRPLLKILGVPVGEHLSSNRLFAGEQGSIIAVVATDAPLMPTQLERIARRAGLGIGRTGTPAGDGSGDLCLAFSSANLTTSESATAPSLGQLSFLPNNRLDPLFEATAQAVEEAIINAMFAAETMVGRENRLVAAIDHNAVKEVMRTYGRLTV